MTDLEDERRLCEHVAAPPTEHFGVHHVTLTILLMDLLMDRSNLVTTRWHQIGRPEWMLTSSECPALRPDAIASEYVHPCGSEGWAAGPRPGVALADTAASTVTLAEVSVSHWDRVWNERAPDEVSWYQRDPALSLQLIEQVTPAPDSVIDVGAGASRLVDRLLQAGYTDLTVVDLAPAALDAARQRLGESAAHVTWLVGDVTRMDFSRRFDLWHDRAVLHFLVDDTDRQRYRAALDRAVGVGAHVVLATFAPGAPSQCSGLPVRHYDPAAMQQFLGTDFEPLDHREEHHETPSGDAQLFLYGLYRRTSTSRSTNPNSPD